MKKILFTAIAALVIFQFDAQAQDKEFGIRAGWQMSITINDGEQVGGNLNTFYVGIFRDRSLGGSEFLYFHGGLDYSTGGWYTDDDNYRKIYYLSGPAALKVKLGPAFVQLGAIFSARLGEKYNLLGEDALTDETKTESFDIGAHVGVGVKIAMVSIEARYNIGFLDVNHGDRNASLQVGAGISF